jgi:hypothetical protein
MYIHWNRFTVSKKQPYRSSATGYVPVPKAVKDKYVPDSQKYSALANKTAPTPEVGEIQHLGVYKTPFSLSDSTAGGVESMSNRPSYSQDTLPSHFVLPPSVYEKSPHLIFLHPVSDINCRYCLLFVFVNILYVDCG